MESKLFEIRDEGTFIPALAVRISGKDGYLARRGGYGAPCVMLTRLQGGKASYDPYDWTDSRTMQVAHVHIAEKWDELPDHSVIDVEFIMGVRATPKKSEQETAPQ